MASRRMLQRVAEIGRQAVDPIRNGSNASGVDLFGAQRRHLSVTASRVHAAHDAARLGRARRDPKRIGRRGPAPECLTHGCPECRRLALITRSHRNHSDRPNGGLVPPWQWPQFACK